MTSTSDLPSYYREKAPRLRHKAEMITNRTARLWLIEGADECELRAIQAELAATQRAVTATPDPSQPQTWR